MAVTLRTLARACVAVVALVGHAAAAAAQQVGRRADSWQPWSAHPVARSAQQLLAERRDEALKDLGELVAIPSVSADPMRAEEVRRAASWLEARLRAAGLRNVEYMPTRRFEGNNGVVYADHLGAGPAAPTLLIYGHYDVQPEAPADQWRSPPFQLTPGEGGKLYGRGASDDKGQGLLPAILALEATIQVNDGRLPFNVKLLLEGQEEVLSPDLREFLSDPAVQAKFRGAEALLSCSRGAALRAGAAAPADYLVSADGSQPGYVRPGLLVGLRGVCGLEVQAVTAKSNMHSGSYGGSVRNALHELSALVASLHHPDGSIAVANFTDTVTPLTDADRAEIAECEESPGSAAEHEAIGAPAHGEPGFTSLERRWARPTVEVVGLFGGYTGAGVQTVLPASATAKITARLAPGMDPPQACGQIEEHLRARAPAGVVLTTRSLLGDSKAFLGNSQDVGNKAAAATLERAFDVAPGSALFSRSGGTIPFAALAEELLGGVKLTVLATSFPDHGVHAPNEFILEQGFAAALMAYAEFFWELRAQHDAAVATAARSEL